MPRQPLSSRWSLSNPTNQAALWGAAAGIAVLLTLAAPGITIDEPLDVRPGRTYVQALEKEGLGFFERSVVDRVFRDNAEHPPLGRWLLGIASTIGQPVETFLLGGPDPRGIYVVAGRFAPAACFAALVALVTHAAGRRYGTASGASAGVGLILMPRAFAHAHLGALDTITTLFWVLALLAAEKSLNGRRPRLGMIGAGVVWGLALLTKIHAWLLIPIVGVLAIGRLGVRRGLVGFSAWAVIGLLVFVAGWPWLWYDGLDRFAGFLGTGVDRATIQVTYFGQTYADRDVPWHYPWFYFLATVPVGLHLLGALGVATSWRHRHEDRFPFLLLGAILFLLVLFSTSIPVYDGERLFLMAFPLWSILIGRGFSRIWEAAANVAARRLVLVLFLIAQGYGLVSLHPFQLSYYNLLVGGLPGAERLGLELTFWNDAVDETLLNELADRAKPGETAALVPTLYPGQGIMTTSRRLAARDLVLGDQETANTSDWLVISRRVAYWSPATTEFIAHARFQTVRSRHGVWLSALVRRNDPGPPEAARDNPKLSR